MAGSQNAAGWPTRLLVDCTSDGNISYGIVQPGQHVESGIPIIRVNNFKNGVLDGSDVLRVSESIEENYRRTRLQGGEVLLTLVGSVGQTAIVTGDLAGWNVARAIAVIRPSEEVSAKWLAICLQSADARHFLDGRANTTVQKTLNLGDVKRVPIPIPPKEVRCRIESMMTSIDDKIDLNRRINQTLEAVAKAIFKSWFVDFDPVKARIAAIQEGRDPLRVAISAICGKPDAELNTLTPEQYEQLSATAALFPDEMEESELGEIPKGWAVGRLDDLLVLQRGFDLPNQDRIPGDFQIVAASGPAGSHSEATVRGPSVVTGRSGVLGRVFLILDDFWPLNTTLWVKEFRAATPCYAYELLRGIDFAAFNAGSAVPTLNRNHIHGLPCLIPHADIMGGFEANALNIHKLLEQNTKEAKSLASLRDTLLPKLLSGELSVTEAMAEVEA
jgi:type I restriction enzyme S subunit